MRPQQVPIARRILAETGGSKGHRGHSASIDHKKRVRIHVDIGSASPPQRKAARYTVEVPERVRL